MVLLKTNFVETRYHLKAFKSIIYQFVIIFNHLLTCGIILKNW